MPINYLKPITDTTDFFAPVEFVKDTLKKPFSWQALALSLGLGLIVAFVVTGILLAVNSLSSRVNQDREVETTKQIVAGETFIDVSKIDTDRDGLFDWQESKFGTDQYLADTDFDGYNDLEEISKGFDPTGLGRPETYVVIEKIALRAPLQFPASREEKDIQAALQKGPVHYPGTAAPGQNGNVYITGHSSDYVWQPGEFKRVFRQLNNLIAGERVVLEQILNNGQVVKYEYQIYDKQVTKVDAPILWQADREGSILTLVTSWPLDSTRERLMVRGFLSPPYQGGD